LAFRKTGLIKKIGQFRADCGGAKQMERITIDYGIDLGTTNSSIAVLKGTETEVIPNNEGIPYTPSAVWISRNQSIYVGKRAKDTIMTNDAERENGFCEFKLQMGGNTEYVSARSGLKLKPEHLSAEVLKALKADVQRLTGEVIDAAVITVPAAFDLPECEATRRAAQLAGFVTSPLLQEPVAAALAYGFQNESEKAFWLVYDLGGGTFDAAVMQIRDGSISVVNHGGDNYLGGKLIDWEIVDQLLVAELLKQHKLDDFYRNNNKWYAAFGKLKLYAEEAKIRLSQHDTAEVIIDRLCDNAPVQFECFLHKADIERITEPFIVQTINICKKVLSEKRLGAGDIEKIILVGGPTQMPYLRERLLDEKKGLGIPLEFNHNPLTVVACGAAIFAGSQRTERKTVKPQKGQYSVMLEYTPVGSDPEPLLGGRVTSSIDDEDLAGFFIEIVNTESRPQWRSGKIALDSTGRFITALWAEKGKKNAFLNELYDKTGIKREISPDTFHYTVGLTIQDVPLTHSIGVALADNDMAFFLQKGVALPAGKKLTLRTAVQLRAGHKDDVITIPVVEGESKRNDRNRLIGTLNISAADSRIRRNVPIGSEVEVTMNVDDSRIITTMAYIPFLDEDFQEVHKLEKPEVSLQQLESERARQLKRLDNVRKQVEDARDPRAWDIMQRIEEERIEHEIEASLAVAQSDRDAPNKCESRILALKTAIDDIEDALEWPLLLSDAEKWIDNLQSIAIESQYADSNDKNNASEMIRVAREAIVIHDMDVLRRRISEVTSLWVRIDQKDPGYWVWWFSKLKEEKSTLKDQNMAEKLFALGERVIDKSDLAGLKGVIQKLWALTPETVRTNIEKGYGGGLQK
jgi:molecular chaperone DnaK